MLVLSLIFLTVFLVHARFPSVIPLRFDFPVFEFAVTVVREVLDDDGEKNG
jgi:uncharacterized membrane protein YhdT